MLFSASKSKRTTIKYFRTLIVTEIKRHLNNIKISLSQESVEGNMTHVLFQVDNDTDVDVYRAKGHNGKIYEVRSS